MITFAIIISFTLIISLFLSVFLDTFDNLKFFGIRAM